MEGLTPAAIVGAPFATALPVLGPEVVEMDLEALNVQQMPLLHNKIPAVAHATIILLNSAKHCFLQIDSACLLTRLPSG